MADETNPTAPGASTSEGRLTKVIQIVCGLVAFASVALTALQGQFPNVVWIQVAGVVVAGIVSTLTSLGYMNSRAVVKAEMIRADSQPPSNPK